AIAGVPTAQGSVSVTALGTVGTLHLTGISAPVAAVAGGNTNVGDIALDPGLVAVSNRGGQSVSLIDPATLSVVATVTIAANSLKNIAVPPNRGRAVVAANNCINNFGSVPCSIALNYIDLTTTPPTLLGSTPNPDGDTITGVEVTGDSRFAIVGGQT